MSNLGRVLLCLARPVHKPARHGCYWQAKVGAYLGMGKTNLPKIVCLLELDVQFAVRDLPWTLAVSACNSLRDILHDATFWQNHDAIMPRNSEIPNLVDAPYRRGNAAGGRDTPNPYQTPTGIAGLCGGRMRTRHCGRFREWKP